MAWYHRRRSWEPRRDSSGCSRCSRRRATGRAPELAERLEVSTRTIRNDIERLRSLGYPVHATRGPIGGYRLAAGATLPPLLLDDDEAVARRGRPADGGRRRGRPASRRSSLRALAKLEQVLPARLRSRVNALQTHTVLVTGAAGPDGRRGGPDAAGRDLPRPSRACASTTRTGTAARASAGSSRIGWSTPAGAGTWSPGTPTGTTGGRSGSIGSGRTCRSAAGSRRATLSDEEVTALVSRGVPPAARRYPGAGPRPRPGRGHRRADRSVGRHGRGRSTTPRCILDTGADTLDILAVHLGMLDADFIGHRRRPSS